MSDKIIDLKTLFEAKKRANQPHYLMDDNGNKEVFSSAEEKRERIEQLHKLICSEHYTNKKNSPAPK